eukprot:XP_003729875.2 PREDICTED: E3 ubiquitin-protein ligase MIB2 isoform X3 [Strongylocentrotus purpuratus]
MLPRSSSPRLALEGSFAGAKVVRHPQWHKRLESDKLLGTVVRHGQTLEDKVNVRAAVEFSSGRERVDLIKMLCTLPGSGGFVYAGHLPNLGDLEPVNEGDNVLVTATPAELEELHKRRGLWQPVMVKTVRKKGFVNRRTKYGDFTVTFQDSQETFTMNSAALRKIHPLCLGQLVRISDNIEMVKRLQSGHGGWTAAMEKAIGTVGKVVEIDGSDIHVKIKGNHKFVFNSVNLTPERFRAPKPEYENFDENLRGLPRAMQDPEWSIMIHAEAGDINKMERILAIHPEWIHNEAVPGITLLGCSAAKGDVRMMKFLVGKGAFIENDHKAPLYQSTLANKYEAVEYLLDQGADVHAVNPQGFTCLAKACELGFFQCAHYLLMHGADLNQKGVHNMTPVLHSIESGGRTIVDLIMDRQEADLKAVSSDLVSGMHAAATLDNTYVLTKLMDKIPRLVEALANPGHSPISVAVFKGCRNAAELLMKKGHCNVNAVPVGTDFGYCPLAMAIAREHFHLVDVLVEHGADVNLPDCSGNTSLQLAIIAHFSGGQKMKKEPYMAEMKRKWGHRGIKTNADALLAFLVSHGGDLNAYNSARWKIKTMLQQKRDPILQPLLDIQSQKRKDIARQQSASKRPLRTLTKTNKNKGTKVSSVSSVLQKSTVRSGSKKGSSGNSPAKLATGSGSQQKSSGKLHNIQTEIKRKDEELETLQSRVKTLEHLVKKKISFACGHDVIRSIAELIPECPYCSEPISSVVDLQ